MVEGRKSTKSIAKYLGYIYGNPNDSAILHLLGVQGQMIWRPDKHADKLGVFEYCIITMDVAKSLRDKYPAFIPTVFTAVDDEGNQTINQPLLFGRYDE
jgi:hypothetical protein